MNTNQETFKGSPVWRIFQRAQEGVLELHPTHVRYLLYMLAVYDSGLREPGDTTPDASFIGGSLAGGVILKAAPDRNRRCLRLEFLDSLYRDFRAVLVVPMDYFRPVVPVRFPLEVLESVKYESVQLHAHGHKRPES